MDDNDDVVIIGAGICGLATALALHKKGIKGVVMERSESLRNVTGAGIAVRPNGWRALDQLGVAEILRHTAVPLNWCFLNLMGDNVAPRDEYIFHEHHVTVLSMRQF
ncbi:putative 3-hydroxybenzoate 6-monooxygenase [Helianthus annuus]|nr:putative 3-hydroxybenzoate 6-monooxygenase [Helianthus annuus]